MRIFEFCKKQKYILTILIFAIYLIFGENNLMEYYSMSAETKMLEFELQQYNEMIATIKEQNTVSSYIASEYKEDFFRKQYHYKKETEDIFRFVASQK